MLWLCLQMKAKWWNKMRLHIAASYFKPMDGGSLQAISNVKNSSPWFTKKDPSSKKSVWRVSCATGPGI